MLNVLKLSTVIILAYAALAFFGYVYFGLLHQARHASPAVNPTSPTTSRSTTYVQQCSGLDATVDLPYQLALANCLGKIRGYADSHQHTFKLLQHRLSIPSSAQLWCIPPDTTDKQLLSSVVKWIDDNARSYDAITDRYSGTTGAMGVLAASLAASYPCKPLQKRK